jgi:hypothetical protein
VRLHVGEVKPAIERRVRAGEMQPHP